jgi:hypothetical protein
MSDATARFGFPAGLVFAPFTHSAVRPALAVAYPLEEPAPAPSPVSP